LFSLVVFFVQLENFLGAKEPTYEELEQRVKKGDVIKGIGHLFLTRMNSAINTISKSRSVDLESRKYQGN
jgi:hypothetical protein